MRRRRLLLKSAKAGSGGMPPSTDGMLQVEQVKSAG